MPLLIPLGFCVLLWIGWRIYRHQTRVNRRLRLLLDALDSADTSMRFPVTTDRKLNTMLNRIAQSLAELRISVIETEKYYESIISAISTGVIVIRDTGHVVLANRAALQLLGRPALTHISSLRQSWGDLTALFEPPRPGIDTTIRNLAVKTTSFTRHDGSRLTIATLDDISSQLASASVGSWQEMSRVLTHEIMNGIAPLTSIAETLRLRYTMSNPNADDSPAADDGDYMLQGLDAITESGRSLKEFIGNYRRLTIIPTPKIIDFPLRPLLDHTILLAQTMRSTDFPDRKVKFNLRLPLKPVSVRADRNQMSQVLLNLIKNAVEASAATITIRVAVTDNGQSGAENSHVSITIQNDGTPIAAETAQRIFTPFFTTKQRGTGIGLSLSQRILLANNGTLCLTSAPEAQTKFTLTLPAAATQTAAEADQNESKQ